MNSPSYQQFRYLLNQGRGREAAEYADRAYLQGNPDNPFWLNMKTIALIRAGQYAEAVSVSKQAFARQPNNPYCIRALGDALKAAGGHEDAAGCYEALLPSLKFSDYAKEAILDCLLKTAQWDRITEYIAAWRLPRPVQLEWKTKILSRRNKLPEAIETCAEWLKLRPDDPKALWALMDLEIQRDGLEYVLHKMERISKIPSRPPIYKEIYASLLRRAGREGRAVKAYEDLSGYCADPRILKKQAFSLARSGNESEAIPLLEELLAREPEDIYLNASYGAALKRTGRLQRGLEFYSRLIAGNPHALKINDHVRKIKNMLNR